MAFILFAGSVSPHACHVCLEPDLRDNMRATSVVLFNAIE